MDRAVVPRVVACVPAYQSAGFIGPVLASLAAQTYPNLEILISVDVCTDATAQICDRFASLHANVRVMRQSQRRGWVGNSNALLEAARGVFCFFAFHDDPLEPRYVERLVEALERAPEAVLAFSDLRSADEVQTYTELEGVIDRSERMRRIMSADGAWWVPFRGVVRTNAVRQAGGMRPLAAGEQHTDRLWLMRLAAQGQFVRVAEPLITKVRRAAGVEASWKKDVRNEIAAQLAFLAVIRGARLPLRREARLYAALLNAWARSIARPLRDAARAFR